MSPNAVYAFEVRPNFDDCLLIFIYRAIGELLVKMVYGEKIFEERGQELIKVNTEGVTLVTWTFTQLWLIHILPIGWCYLIPFPRPDHRL
jgi:hypothetical protein